MGLFFQPLKDSCLFFHHLFHNRKGNKNFNNLWNILRDCKSLCVKGQKKRWWNLNLGKRGGLSLKRGVPFFRRRGLIPLCPLWEISVDFQLTRTIMWKYVYIIFLYGIRSIKLIKKYISMYLLKNTYLPSFCFITMVLWK